MPIIVKDSTVAGYSTKQHEMRGKRACVTMEAEDGTRLIKNVLAGAGVKLKTNRVGGNIAIEWRRHSQTFGPFNTNPVNFAVGAGVKVTVDIDDQT